MPFAGYRDFGDCVAKNQDKRDPEAYCAAIKQNVEKTGLTPEQEGHNRFIAAQETKVKRGERPFYQPGKTHPLFRRHTAKAKRQ